MRKWLKAIKGDYVVMMGHNYIRRHKEKCVKVKVDLRREGSSHKKVIFIKKKDSHRSFAKKNAQG